jgi:hypothetical protein
MKRRRAPQIAQIAQIEKQKREDRASVLVVDPESR